MAEVQRSMQDGLEIKIGQVPPDTKERRFAEETGSRIAERARILTERNRIVGPAAIPNPFCRN